MPPQYAECRTVHINMVSALEKRSNEPSHLTSTSTDGRHLSLGVTVGELCSFSAISAKWSGLKPTSDMYIVSSGN